VWEHGVLTAEVRGLEIARIENGELAVGVGKHDREGHRMANPDADPVVALQSLADRVRLERTADAPQGLMTSLSRDGGCAASCVRTPNSSAPRSSPSSEPPLPRRTCVPPPLRRS